MSKVTTIRFDDDFHKELSIAMIKRGVPSLQVLVSQVLREWLGGYDKPSTTISGSTRKPTAVSQLSTEEPPVQTDVTATEELESLLQMAREIILSDTVQGLALEANILSFWPRLPKGHDSHGETDTDTPDELTVRQIRRTNERAQKLAARYDAQRKASGSNVPRKRAGR